VRRFDRVLVQHRLILEPLEERLDAEVRGSLDESLGSDVFEREKADGRASTVHEALALARVTLRQAGYALPSDGETLTRR